MVPRWGVVPTVREMLLNLKIKTVHSSVHDATLNLYTGAKSIYKETTVAAGQQYNTKFVCGEINLLSK